MDVIDPSNLPQTICDAINVTHVLGFRFLWVDRLCIIQYSQEDKHRELHYMRGVYFCAQLCSMPLAQRLWARASYKIGTLSILRPYCLRLPPAFPPGTRPDWLSLP
ncbi:HET-domain-containing protein [Cubamyces sp. BRFM 1775]|nr:HET-domain-containing protein [Cubamyces sp. BRFM 1775]